ncbi:transglycosylase SLT domain-containing protein [Acetobacter conturbans]|uniref:Transglycosylase SLT domain-containing protein n=1 Tax=Acetobacter conturbans TaxID=1737472 RepID=A0ABX0K258_9PROT|nr:transglycosylase SLT domain-containing protein [Acetobacter conturbans]NHN89194.1 transglycosylase SLT domain-containing protein [Acetobacter conturbans]
MRRIFFLVMGALALPVSQAWGESLLAGSVAPARTNVLSGMRPANGMGSSSPVMTLQRPSGAISPADARLCSSAILMAERSQHIPDQFLVAMGRVESGRHVNGELVPWPWTVNAQGKGYVYDTKQQAVEAVRAFQAQGIRSIDVGCLQVNLLQHADAFPSLDAAFDPVTNALYAARFLNELFSKTGSWPRAAAAYHSFTPEIGTAYQWKVLESWAMPSGVMGPRSGSPGTGRAVAHVSPLSPMTQPATPYVTASSAAASLSAMGGGGGAAAAGGAGVASGGVSGSPAATSFHPAVHGYSPPPSRPTMSGGNGGHSLAFYRANPVHAIRSAMIMPSRF